ncbi:hypothetical protein XELAEV_18011821mg [Xenopus laevis]|uniref:Uncharacterized protein n=1 Tax=Xenopus laevis TaxID=8355 RepID=A0A974DN06_XENLA|nr:hypothetical protein XELAEV_18011821mg [Xenopus laevis]
MISSSRQTVFHFCFWNNRMACVNRPCFQNHFPTGNGSHFTFHARCSRAKKVPKTELKNFKMTYRTRFLFFVQQICKFV